MEKCNSFFSQLKQLRILIKNKEYKSKGIYTGIPYQFDRLNEYLTSIDRGQAIGVLGGTGVGYSVQKHHVEALPEIHKPNTTKNRRYLIGDSIEGWSDAVKMLMKSYFSGGPTLNFDFRDIRPKGARLITSGGKAPGPQPLRECLIKIQGILETKQNGDKLQPIEIGRAHV